VDLKIHLNLKKMPLEGTTNWVIINSHLGQCRGQ
jgi:hypothetical protein